MEKATAEHPVSSVPQEITRPSLALFDRREQEHVAVMELPLPAKMLDGAREVKISPDQRQALCYQCHAPVSTLQVRSGDDRTPIGVHEGLSCLACHAKHGQQTRASCSTCHPKLSNCGIAGGNHGHHVQEHEKPAQHSLREVHGLPHARDSEEARKACVVIRVS